MIELLIIILLVLVFVPPVLSATGHPFPGGNLLSFMLLILIVALIVALFGGVLD